jgi:hypothetical protein
MRKPMIVRFEPCGPGDPVTICKLVQRDTLGGVPAIWEGVEVRIGFPVKQLEYYPEMIIKFPVQIGF